MSSAPLRHVPVLLASKDSEPSPVIDLLAPSAGESVLDVTLGLGGHSEAFLKSITPGGTLTALDADPENLELARARLKPFEGRVTLIHANFRNVAHLSLPPFDIVFADLGLSSPHVDDPERGFSFRTDAPLDLRFDRTRGRTAAELLQKTDSYDITAILRDLGGIERPRKLAEALSSAFQDGASRTSDAKDIVEAVYGYRAPALLPQVFQALRIAVNDEIGALKNLLAAIPSLLKPGGRAGIISYHSLEDKLVKDCFRQLSSVAKDELTGADLGSPEFEIVTKKPVTPSDEELARNPRSRSAKLRVIRRSDS